MSSRIIIGIVRAFALAGVVVGISAVTAPEASADVRKFNDCIAGTPNPGDVVKHCCIYAGGTYGGGGSPTATETCTFNGNALSREQAPDTPPISPKAPLVVAVVPPQSRG